MLSSDRVWMFNDNDSDHRGVWHIIDGELQIETIPERVWDWDAGVWQRHSKKCSGELRYVPVESDRGWQRYDYIYFDCDCELDHDREEKLVGSFIERTITPEHQQISNQPVLCNQVKLRGSQNRYSSGKRTPLSKRVDGGIHVTVKKLRQLNVWTGELPPGPTCSRCIKKAEEREDAD